MNSPSDDLYFRDIQPVFNLIGHAKESGMNQWRDLTNKDGSIYKPLLFAIKKQIERLEKSSSQNICSNLLGYLIGKNDFYKVVLERKKAVSIQGFNFNATLNKSANDVAPIHRVSVSRLPKRIHSIEFRDHSNNTLNIVMDEGWSISMRIHNAKKELENSLKLDVQLIGIPQNQYRETLFL